MDEEEVEYEVEAIRRHRIIGENIKYEVKWKGYPEEQNTWEEQENMENSKKVLSKYWIKAFNEKTHIEDIEMEQMERYVSEALIMENITVTVNYPSEDIDWNLQVDYVDRIYPKKNKFHVVLKWKDGKFTKHNLNDIRFKIPAKIIAYFEKHIVWVADSKATKDVD